MMRSARPLVTVAALLLVPLTRTLVRRIIMRHYAGRFVTWVARVDRRGVAYDAEATVAAFTTQLRDAVEIDAIRADLLAAVNRAVEPSHASVWIKP